MREVDRTAPEPVDVLVARAGAAVAREAVAIMGGTYGRRVVVVAGKGNNGADGRDAARRLTRRGVRVTVVDAAATPSPPTLPVADLVIDAAYGTGFRGEYEAPDPGGAPVLAVDIPSGVDGLTGRCGPGAVSADRTVTFAALKPGLLFADGPTRAGALVVADIGLDVSSGGRSHTGLVEGTDVARWLPVRDRDAHKWRSAVWVVAGSPGMTGASHLCARGAMRAGAGTVRLGTPGAVDQSCLSIAPEIVIRPLSIDGWEKEVLDDLGRCRALVVGPGLGRSPAIAASVQRLLCLAAQVPAVVDADALWALGDEAEAASVMAHRRAPTILTPHEGEFTAMTGGSLPDDRLAEVRRLAAALGVTVLLKGPVTVVADPTGATLLCNQGDARLATAGTGDVLSGVAGAFLAQGLDALEAGAAAAYVHGAAGRHGWSRGLVAGDVAELIPAALADLANPSSNFPRYWSPDDTFRGKFGSVGGT